MVRVPIVAAPIAMRGRGVPGERGVTPAGAVHVG